MTVMKLASSDARKRTVFGFSRPCAVRGCPRRPLCSGLLLRKRVPLTQALGPVDFYLPQFRVVYEVDGCFWHMNLALRYDESSR